MEQEESKSESQIGKWKQRKTIAYIRHRVTRKLQERTQLAPYVQKYALFAKNTPRSAQYYYYALKSWKGKTNMEPLRIPTTPTRHEAK